MVCAEPGAASAKGKAGAAFTATVPVYLHVVTDGAIGNLTRSQIGRSDSGSERDLRRREGGADSGFTFELAGVTRTDNAKWFYASIGGAEHAMKKALRTGGGQCAQHLLDHGRPVSRLGVPAFDPRFALAGVPGRRCHRLGVVVGDVGPLRGLVRPGRDGNARGRPLAQPRAHLLQGLHDHE